MAFDTLVLFTVKITRRRLSMIYRIGVIGDYDEKRPSHLATNKALNDCKESLKLNIEIIWLPTDSLVEAVNEKLSGFHGLFCSPGSPYKSMTGAINAIQYARENNVPFIGTCGGFQHAVLEYAINKLGYENATHGEHKHDSTDIFIAPLACSLLGETRDIIINTDTFIFEIYKSQRIIEKYNCSFGINPVYQKIIHDNGFQIAAVDDNGDARMLIIPGHKFYVATLFQPQLSSTKEQPHKLIQAYLKSITTG
jgi:CTP synthase (UTP-ammonia lyase)